MAKRTVDYAADPRAVVTFRCTGCKHTWKEIPPQVIDAPEQEYHPWRYLADCPECGRADCTQAPWEKAWLAMAASGNSGPKTEAGKRRCSLNRIGTHTPEEIARTRFNRMKHGLYAKVAVYYPAKPGKYPQCANCRWLDNGCGTWDHGACLEQMDLFFKHRIAFQTKNPALLTELQADLQANTQALISNLLIQIVQTGVEVRQPKWYTDKEGKLQIVEYLDADGNQRRVEDITANPLIKPLYELLGKNSEILGRLGMTEKAQDDDAALQGFIQREEKDTATLADHSHRQTAAMEKLLDLVERSRERQKRDPVLIEHARGEDG